MHNKKKRKNAVQGVQRDLRRDLGHARKKPDDPQFGRPVACKNGFGLGLFMQTSSRRLQTLREKMLAPRDQYGTLNHCLRSARGLALRPRPFSPRLRQRKRSKISFAHSALLWCTVANYLIAVAKVIVDCHHLITKATSIMVPIAATNGARTAYRQGASHSSPLNFWTLVVHPPRLCAIVLDGQAPYDHRPQPRSKVENGTCATGPLVEHLCTIVHSGRDVVGD